MDGWIEELHVRIVPFPPALVGTSLCVSSINIVIV
jgi:hypothetical protein